MSKYLQDLETIFFQNKNETAAVKQAAYLKDLFPFFGLSKPLRSSLEKPLFKEWKISSEEALLDVLKLFWSQPEREYHYSALELAIKHKKLLTTRSLTTLEHMLRTHSWWDSVDTIASHLIGHVIKKIPSRNHLNG